MSSHQTRARIFLIVRKDVIIINNIVNKLLDLSTYLSHEIQKTRLF